EMDIAPVADANGWYTHWIAILRDTTARKQSEDRLRERELKLQQVADHQAAILDALPAHVALLDQNGCILSVSRSWHDFALASGIDAPAPVGRSYLEFGAANSWSDLDVTSNKLAEEALRREKEFSEFLIKSSTEGIVVFDREFRITLWNPGMER